MLLVHFCPGLKATDAGEGVSVSSLRVSIAQASAMGANRRRDGFLPSETGRLGPGGPESEPGLCPRQWAGRPTAFFLSALRQLQQGAGRGKKGKDKLAWVSWVSRSNLDVGRGLGRWLGPPRQGREDAATPQKPCSPDFPLRPLLHTALCGWRERGLPAYVSPQVTQLPAAR